MYDDINSVIVQGRLVDDAQVKEKIVTFAIANNYTYKSNNEYKEGTNFFNIALFTNSEIQGHFREKLAKGQKVSIKGKLVQDRWESEDGSPRSAVKIVADPYGGIKFEK